MGVGPSHILEGGIEAMLAVGEEQSILLPKYRPKYWLPVVKEGMKTR